MTSDLCNECQAIFRHWGDRWEWDKLRPDHSHHNIRDLEDSARQGCAVCSLFFDSLDSDDARKIQQANKDTRGSVFIRRALGGGFWYSELSFTLSNDDIVEAVIEVSLASVDDSATKVGQIAPTTDCDTSWTLVRKWLSQCLTSHDMCTRRLLPRKLPTRLVQVGRTDLDIRLCLSEFLPIETEYLTLSHCWGNIPFKTLTRQNLDSMQKNIPKDMLVKTFKDAIEITRRLGFRYIWIDSLCILQGDQTDWQHESAMMGSVYASSSLNIAATHAPDGNTGCFFDRDTSIVHGYKVSLLDEKNSTSETMWNCCSRSFYNSGFTNNALGSRAWAFQERLLAPRSLNSGAGQLFWECRERSCCETFPKSFYNMCITTSGLCEILLQSNQDHLPHTWFDIVEAYSGRNLTFTNDKLVALSGAAQLFASRFKISYLAGLWNQNLELQLMWYRGINTATKRPEVYRAPSWSWASSDGSARLPPGINAGQVSYYTSVEDVSVTLSTDDPFGQVSDGYLKVKCQTPVCGRANINNCKILLEDSMISPAFIFPDNNPHPLDGHLFYVPVLVTGLHSVDSSRTRLWGLVLEPINEGLFRRVGAFYILYEQIDKFRACQIENIASAEKTLGQPTSVDDDGNPLYTITIK